MATQHTMAYVTLRTTLRYTVATLVVTVFMFPLFWLMLTAIKPRSAVFNKDGVVWFQFLPTIESFQSVWFGPAAYAIRDSMQSSVLIAIGATTVTLLVSTPAAFILSRLLFDGRRLFLVGILLHRFMPPIAIIIPLLFIYNNLGLRDTYLGIILAHTLMNTPIAILLLKSFFDDVSKNIDDMSYIDGATRFQSFWYIILPTVRGGIAATMVLCFIFSWTEFLLSLFLTNSIRTMPIRMALYDPGSQIPLIAAAGVSSTIPAIFFILMVQKHLTRGLTMGALKE